MKIREFALVVLFLILVAPRLAAGEADWLGLALLEHTFVANQSDLAARRAAEERFDMVAGRLTATVRELTSKQDQARAIHKTLHCELLIGEYQANGSNVAAAINGDSFNCATASVLFLALADRAELETQAVSRPGHVWCRVGSGGQTFDVEPASRRFVIREGASGTKCAERLLDRPAVVALFYYNRGVEQSRRADHATAMISNLQALALDPHCRPAQANLRGAVNNALLAMAAAGRSNLARLGLGAATWWAPEFEPFQANYRFLSQ